MEMIAKARTQMVIFALLAFWALIAAIVLVIILIVKKEKRKQMKKTKIAAGILSLLVPIMSFISVDNYDECKSAYGGTFELVIDMEQYSFEYPKGTIIEQDIQPNSMTYSLGTEIHCVVSRGARMVTIDSVISLDFEDAKSMLETNGFTVGYVSEYSDDVPKGKVIATDPPTREKAVYGSAVKVTVSGGKEPEVTE